MHWRNAGATCGSVLVAALNIKKTDLGSSNIIGVRRGCGVDQFPTTNRIALLMASTVPSTSTTVGV